MESSAFALACSLTSRLSLIHISTEFDQKTTHPVISLQEEQKGIQAMGATMRLEMCIRDSSDIVLVGEMRDLETISLALTAAETGLLVFGTLHTNNALSLIHI